MLRIWRTVRRAWPVVPLLLALVPTARAQEASGAQITATSENVSKKVHSRPWVPAQVGSRRFVLCRRLVWIYI